MVALVLQAALSRGYIFSSLCIVLLIWLLLSALCCLLYDNNMTSMLVSSLLCLTCRKFRICITSIPSLFFMCVQCVRSLSVIMDVTKELPVTATSSIAACLRNLSPATDNTSIPVEASADLQHMSFKYHSTSLVCGGS